MFIREIVKKNAASPKTFVYHRLMESVRTPKGPRQRILLNLGHLDLPRSDWKALANRIEEVLSGQDSFEKPAPDVESLAQHYAQQLRRREMQSIPTPEKEAPDWETVDLNSLAHSESRTIGGEAVAHEFWKRLGFPQMLAEMGLERDEIDKATLLVIGRLLHPTSERGTALWAERISGLGELLGANFQHLGNNSLYRTSDRLVEHRDEIERRLAQREKGLFHLGEKIVLYDLTNSYLTGRAHESNQARHGRSKEKRSDCPLLTLALVLDEDGFPKASRLLPGNVSEPGTLEHFLQILKPVFESQLPLRQGPPTVVIDAGIGTEDNLALMRREGFHYISVSRKRPKEIPQEGLTVIREGPDSTIQAKRLDRDGEVLLYCESSARARKEEAIKARFQQHFEQGLGAIAGSLTKKGGAKSYERVLERMGRLKEKYPTISQFYQVEVEHELGIVKKIIWSIDRQEELKVRFSGSYYLRSDRTDLDEKELWSLYMMLTQVEDAFRCLKSELGLRPTFHRIDRRLEGHFFISVLAYHLLASIRRELKKKGISRCWSTVRDLLATQNRSTSSLTNDKGQRIHIRKTGDPEPFHLEVYRALGLPPKPLKVKRLTV
jgi:transposase